MTVHDCTGRYTIYRPNTNKCQFYKRKENFKAYCFSIKYNDRQQPCKL